MSLFLLAALLATPADAQQTVCEGQIGDAAISCIQANYSPSGTLGYDTARDTLYASIDASASGQLEGIYSGFTITLAPGEDPTGDAFDKGINAEHVYPQSKGAGSEPRKSDMHNLRPSRVTVNSARGSLPFGESPDNQTDDWYFEDHTQSSTPDSGIDAWSERLDGSVFEPREAKEGDVARTIFYFYSVYRPSAEDAFFDGMKDQLLQWHQADPPTEAELARSEAIAQRQGNENPFVLDATLAERAFGGDGGDGPPPIFSEPFDESLGQFFQFSAASNANWTHETSGGDGFAQMNGFGADEASNDWLISPALDLSGLESAELVAEIGKQFDGPDLKLQVSTDYGGSGDPTGANWTEETSIGASGNVTAGLSGYAGESSVYVAFQYTSTGTGAGDGAEFTVDDVTVGPEAPNQPPVARPDTFSTSQGQALTVDAPGVLENDSDPDGDSLSASLISGVTGGSLTLDSDGSVEYVPDTSFTGTDSFTYAAAAGSAADTATVTIEIESAGTPVTIAEARSQGPGATVTVEGTVSRAFGAYARLQDESGPTGASGLVIRQTAGENSEAFQGDIAEGNIQPGTQLQVTGITSEFAGLFQLNNDDLSSYEILAQGGVPSPQVVSLTDLQAPDGEDYESELIEVAGLSFPEASGTFESGTTYTAEGAGGTAFDFRVQDSSETGIIGAPIPEGSFTYQGVLGQFNSFVGGDEGYQLIPVRPSDVQGGPGECVLAWSLGLGGTDAAGDSLSVTFGQSPVATAGIDPGCGEEEQPPKPPSEVFDLRFTGTDLPGIEVGEGLIRDIRPTGQPTPESAESVPATWRLEVQSSSYPVTLTWDNSALADSLPGVPVRLVDVVTGGDLVDVDMKSTGSYTLENSSVTALEIRLDRALTREVPIEAGWNLLSVPLEAEDPSFGTVLAPCESGFFFEPSSGYSGIAEGEAVPVGRGLFANCAAGTAQVTGQAPGPTIEVAQGWNIIGALADSVDVGSVTSDPAGIVQTSFFGFDDGYQSASVLAPGGGYWVKAGESGTLDLSGSGGGAALASTQATSKSQKKPGAKLRLTDAAGREATLRLTSELTEAQRKQGALPPVPPGGVFDVRFEGGRSVAEAGDDGALHAIKTQGLKAPVTVRLANAEEGQSVQVRHGGSETRLTAESPSAELSQVEDLAVGLQSAPEAFALKKTYPNPASGRATVEYALPEQAEVTIAVYDVLGRRIATLRDGPVETGRHRAELDAGQMPSGTYFVRMRAEGFQQTRRLTVVR